MIEINSMVPNFSLIGSDKKEHSLSEYKGKKVMGIERSTFIINEEGILVREYRKVKVKGHIDTILEDLRNI